MSTKRTLILSLAFLGAAIIAYGFACNLPAPTRTAITNQHAPQTTIAPLSNGLTFARATTENGEGALLLVVDIIGADIIAIDLSPMLASADAELGATPFDAIAALGRDRLSRLALANQGDAAQLAGRYPIASLLPVATADRHIAFGTNFPAHGEEVDNERPYAFPKFGVPTAAVSTVTVPQTGLLDYEVELCMVFDRDIRTTDDFDAARKAVFLCGDFTNRDLLVRLLPGDEAHLSGIGFTDAKSAPGFMPTGPFIVVPDDWRTFVSSEVIATELNGALMQHASGAEMTLDFKDMTRFALREGDRARWRFRDAPIQLVERGVIRKGTVLLSGTPSGVLFRPPSDREITCGAIAYGCLAGFLSGATPREYVVDRFLKRLRKSGVFLQDGDIVEHKSRHLGDITAYIADERTSAATP